MTINDYMIRAKDAITDGWMIAALTDEYNVEKWPVHSDYFSGKENKVLEIRVFGKLGELKISRSDIGKEFHYRDIFDEGEKADTRDHYDEIQYLDIDEKINIDSDGKVTTTGGGTYKLPLSNIHDARIRIRYYFGKYEETGQARIEDWRVVEFVEGK